MPSTELLALIALSLVALAGVVVTLFRCRRTVRSGTALVISDTTSTPKVVTSGTVTVWPLVHRAEMVDLTVHSLRVQMKGATALSCRDNIRVDVEAVFFVHVNNCTEDILIVARKVGCEHSGDAAKLETLFKPMFVEALATVAKSMRFEDLVSDRELFKHSVANSCGRDLGGFVLSNVAVDYLEQTPAETLDPNNINDAEGLRMISERTGAEALAKAQAELARDRALMEVQQEHASIRQSLH